MSRVLVLNATYEPINVCTVRRAVVLLLKQKAEVLEEDETELHAETFTQRAPVVIRLVAYVRLPRGGVRRLSRKAVFARDGWSCQYCGAEAHLTVDHVVPRSRGGKTEWTNVVAACASCNRRKRDWLPGEAGMKLRAVPKPPGAVVFVYLTARTVPPVWTPYLPTLAA